jgi:hypothetical protein
MKRSIATAITLAAVFAAGLGVSFAAEGSGSCGKGKVYNPETQKCVAKPKGSSSGSNSG